MKHTRMLEAALVVVTVAVAAGVVAAQGAEPLTLAQCVEYALGHNPSLAAAGERVAASATRIGQARAEAQPQLDARAAYNDAQPTAGDFRNYSMTLSARQLLYDNGETRARTAQAEAQHDGARLTLDTLRLDIANAVARDYFAVLRARRLAEVAVEVRDQARAHHALARARYDAGTVPGADVLRAEVEVARAQLEVISAEQAEELASARLLNTLGRSQDEPVEIAPVEPSFPPALDLAAGMALATAHRSELTALAAQTRAAEAAVRLARAANGPELTLQSDWGMRENSFPPTDEAWSIGLGASVSILDGGLARERVDEARAEVRALAAEREVQVQRIELEVAEALLAEEVARQRIDLAEQELALARHSLEVAAGRYGVGEGTLIEVTDARTALSRALAGQAAALYDHHGARADLARAVGLLPTEELPQ